MASPSDDAASKPEPEPEPEPTAFKMPSLPPPAPPAQAQPASPTPSPVIAPPAPPASSSSKSSKYPPCPYAGPPADWPLSDPALDKSSGFALEVVKGGAIVQRVELDGDGDNQKTHYSFGRLPTCDVQMEHPSLSRYHAVLQYRSQSSPDQPKGFYLYDLGSTHGSYHNGKRCYPKQYYHVAVGHVVKFGGSTRLVVLQGPEEDMEEESELSVTELRERARLKEEARRREEEERKRKMEEEEEKESFATWGMAEDAVEEEDDDEEHPDMSKNPFGKGGGGGGKELELDDPKKTLRGWFEREGYDLPEYRCEEKGFATFQCQLDLPVDSDTGRTTLVEVTHQGKKKEAVAACALEACRLLDRHGLLRQARHESRAERQKKRWQEDEFYDSDEDDFLDRTGALEEKRRRRQQLVGGGEAPKVAVETHETLVKKCADAAAEMAVVERELAAALEGEKRKKAEAEKEEDLDAYMAGLKAGANVDKLTIRKLKLKLADLKKESSRLEKMAEIARPTKLPALRPPPPSSEEEAKKKTKLQGVLVGKRRGGRLGRLKTLNPTDKVPMKLPTLPTLPTTKPSAANTEEASNSGSPILPDRVPPPAGEAAPVHDGDETTESPALKRKSPPIQEEAVSEKEEEVPSPKKMRGPLIPEYVKQALQTDAKHGDHDDDDESEDAKPAQEEAPKRKRGSRPKKGGGGSQNAARKTKEGSSEEDSDDETRPDTARPSGSAAYNTSDPKYATWMPPEGQTGDGKTSLNEKYGY